MRELRLEGPASGRLSCEMTTGFGGDSGGVTPVPIPNTEVKPASADGTWVVTPWESRTPPDFVCLKALRSMPQGLRRFQPPVVLSWSCQASGTARALPSFRHFSPESARSALSLPVGSARIPPPAAAGSQPIPRRLGAQLGSSRVKEPQPVGPASALERRFYGRASLIATPGLQGERRRSRGTGREVAAPAQAVAGGAASRGGPPRRTQACAGHSAAPQRCAPFRHGSQSLPG